jgi:hypothetical protein
MSKLTLTVVAPEPDRDDATHLAVALGWIEGWSPEEWEHAFTSQYQDAQGNLYRVMSCPVGETFIQTASGMGPIERPPQDVGELDPETGEHGPPYVVNLTAAHRAQAKLVSWAGEGAIPQASPETIVAIAGMKGTEALAAMGLGPLPVEFP